MAIVMIADNDCHYDYDYDYDSVSLVYQLPVKLTLWVQYQQVQAHKRGLATRLRMIYDMQGNSVDTSAQLSLLFTSSSSSSSSSSS